MPIQQLTWTALPAGVDDGGLRVSVLVSFRLEPDQEPATLSVFPDLLDWPSVSLGWRVGVGGAPPESAEVVSEPPSSTLWTALFSATTPVRSQPFPDLSAHRWWSYPAGHVADLIQELYGHIATHHPTEHPPVADLLDPAFGLRALAYLRDDGRDLRPERLRELAHDVIEPGGLSPGPADPERDVLQLWQFHQSGPVEADRPEPPAFDFHEAVAMVCEHPGLARRLGLVVDLLVQGDPPAGATTIQAEPVWEPDPATSSVDVRPVTACRVDDGAFLPEPRDPTELVRGRLPLADGAFRTVQVDVDSGALNLMSYARNLVHAQQNASGDTPTEEPAPRLRSAGIAVVRTGHAEVVRDGVLTAAQLHTQRQEDQEVLLHAEDVTRGYRFDVWSSITGRWHSLQRRIGDHHFLTTDVHEEIIDEGAVVEVPTDRGDDFDGNPALYLQESLMHWEGWSLAAPRPGRTLLEDDSVGDAPDDAASGYPLVMRFRAEPGSLPRLRFGAGYRLRARAVDVAGHSVPFDEDDAQATEVVRYLRFEPVATPVVLFQAPRTEGETVERLVLRSDVDEDPSPPNVQRHLAPPKTSQRTAEEHGRYDNAEGLDPQAYASIVAREARSFQDDDIAVVDVDQWPEAYRLPYFPQTPLEVPYLPDPLARGAALRGLPGAVEDVVLCGFDHPDGWPQSRAVRLVLQEGDGHPQITTSAGERVLTVELPKAHTARVRLSCHLDGDDLAVSAIWNWMIQHGTSTAAQIDEWRTQAEQGRLWMITPYRILTLVHATRRPLATPEFSELQVNRQLGDTRAGLNDLLSYHRRSTSRVDLEATWVEPVDTGPGDGTPAPAPTEREHRQMLEVHDREEAPEDFDLLPLGIRQEFGDTKHRRVTYTAIATSAFTEYFVVTDAFTVPAQGTVTLPAEGDGLVEGSETVRRGEERMERDLDYTLDHLTGLLSRVPTGRIEVGDTIVVAYLPEPVSRRSTTPVTLDVPNSARPGAPKFLYAIPTHRWLRGRSAASISSNGLGGGLRIYLDRPMFSSGEGELLGVLLDPDPGNPSDALAPYVTRWGFDPTVGGPSLPSASPRLEHLPLAAATASGLSLDENGATVDVAGHTLDFDEDRGLWSCDIEVDAGDAVWPFIRLALASFQPDSLQGAHLSRVVLADFMQLTNDRFVALEPATDGGSIAVSILGSVGTTSTAGRPATEVFARVERSIEGIDDDMLRWQPLPGHRPFALTPTRDQSGRTRWTGRVPLPAAAGGATGELRLVIEEQHRTTGTAAPGRPTRDPGLLYRDIVPLTIRR